MKQSYQLISSLIFLLFSSAAAATSIAQNVYSPILPKLITPGFYLIALIFIFASIYKLANFRKSTVRTKKKSFIIIILLLIGIAFLVMPSLFDIRRIFMPIYIMPDTSIFGESVPPPPRTH